LPAASAIAPLLGTITVKTTSAPVAPVSGDGFGQVLRSAQDAAVGGSAPANDAQGPQALGTPDPGLPPVETQADQVVVTDNVATSRSGPSTAKSQRSGKDDGPAPVPQDTAAMAANPGFVGGDDALAAVSWAAAAAKPMDGLAENNRIAEPQATTGVTANPRWENDRTVAPQAIAGAAAKPAADGNGAAVPQATIGVAATSAGNGDVAASLRAPIGAAVGLAENGNVAETTQAPSGVAVGPAGNGKLTAATQAPAGVAVRPAGGSNQMAPQRAANDSAMHLAPVKGGDDLAGGGNRAGEPAEATATPGYGVADENRGTASLAGVPLAGVPKAAWPIPVSLPPPSTLSAVVATKDTGAKAISVPVATGSLTPVVESVSPATESAPVAAGLPAAAAGPFLPVAGPPSAGPVQRFAARVATQTDTVPAKVSPAQAGGAAASVPAALPVSIQEPPDPAAVSARAATDQPAEPAATEPASATVPAVPVSRTPASVAGRDTTSPGWDAASLPSAQVVAPRDATPATADPSVPSQSAPAVVSNASSPQVNPAPLDMQLAAPATVTVSPPASTEAANPLPSPAPDHKVTLRPVEAGTDPAQPQALPGASLEQAAPVVTQEVVSTATLVGAAPAVHSASLASAAGQVAPALLVLAKTMDGGQQMTVRLHPAELGMVQVRIARAVSGATQIEISADNPVTLLALQRDQPQLHRTLDDAGIPAAGRTVTFHIAQAEQAAASGHGPGSPGGHAGGQQGSASRSNAGSTNADGSAGGGRGSYPARERNTYSTSRRSTGASATSGGSARTAGKTYRIGLDITA
jgi:flagellar hook-length control protein FliK